MALKLLRTDLLNFKLWKTKFSPKFKSYNFSKVGVQLLLIASSLAGSKLKQKSVGPSNESFGHHASSQASPNRNPRQSDTSFQPSNFQTIIGSPGPSSFSPSSSSSSAPLTSFREAFSYSHSHSQKTKSFFRKCLKNSLVS